MSFNGAILLGASGHEVESFENARMTLGYHVVDLFAGPGGLAEGFSAASCDGVSRPFRIALSVECDPAAHATLTLRTFLRQFESGYPIEYYQFLNEGLDEPDWRELYPEQWEKACEEAPRLRLGAPEDDAFLDRKLVSLRERYGDKLIVTGGPPCQAYSLVGRVRNAKVAGYTPEGDVRYRLYKEYVRILCTLKPAAFVMENVKGLLSAKLGSDRVIDRILAELRNPDGVTGYRLLAIQPTGSAQKVKLAPSDFVVRSELHGIPQARHRIIVIGIRNDLANLILDTNQTTLELDRWPQYSTVDDAIGGLSRLRSGVSKDSDTYENWLEKALKGDADLAAEASKLPALTRSAGAPNGVGDNCPTMLGDWLRDPKLLAVPNHQTRSHIAGDLRRYRFAAAFARKHNRSPKASDFPNDLAPDHANWSSGNFSDRFRVQIADAPATTITSHIAKDGHYFIHPDPAQCRSLTVREAARLQTFPDNYFFKGNRTQQYTQVGNAVPPLLAKQIGDLLAGILFKAEKDISSGLTESVPSSLNCDERSKEYV